MKKMVAILLCAGCSLLASACGDDDSKDEGSSDVGHCTTAEQCFEVTMPADYDLAFDCALSKGTAGKGACDTTMYDIKCTEVTQVSEDDGPEQDVTYVYYRPADTQSLCAGEETDL